jgi:hypothetical protein
MRLCKTLSAVLLLAATAGCHSDYYYPTATTYPAVHGVTVATPPPLPLVETIPPSPFYGAVWQAGYWDFNPMTRRFVWIHGRWAATPRDGVVYLPAHWARTHNGYVLISGQWRLGQPYDRYGRHVWYDGSGYPHYF